MSTTLTFTPEAVRDVLLAAYFAEYDPDDSDPAGFEVAKAALGPEICVWLRGWDLTRYNPHEGPKVLLDGYLEALDAAGYVVRPTGSVVIVAGVKGD